MRLVVPIENRDPNSRIKYGLGQGKDIRRTAKASIVNQASGKHRRKLERQMLNAGVVSSFYVRYGPATFVMFPHNLANR